MIEELKALANQGREISLYQANAVAAIIVKMADALEALAAALIFAELDRQDRAAEKKGGVA